MNVPARKIIVRASKHGSSMFPFFFEKDKLFFRLIDQHYPLAAGNVVFFKSKVDSRLVCHRIAKIQNQTVITRGDNRTVPDALRKRSEILGILAKIQRKDRVLSLTSPWGKLYSSLSLLLIDKRWGRLENFIIQRKSLNQLVYALKQSLFKSAFVLVSWLSTKSDKC